MTHECVIRKTLNNKKVDNGYAILLDIKQNVVVTLLASRLIDISDVFGHYTINITESKSLEAKLIQLIFKGKKS